VGNGKMVPERLDAFPFFEDRDHVLIEDLRRQTAVEIYCGQILDAALLFSYEGATDPNNPRRVKLFCYSAPSVPS
jgi:hypothetical protein